MSEQKKDVNVGMRDMFCVSVFYLLCILTICNHLLHSSFKMPSQPKLSVTYFVSFYNKQFVAYNSLTESIKILSYCDEALKKHLWSRLWKVIHGHGLFSSILCVYKYWKAAILSFPPGDKLVELFKNDWHMSVIDN